MPTIENLSLPQRDCDPRAQTSSMIAAIENLSLPQRDCDSYLGGFRLLVRY